MGDLRHTDTEETQGGTALWRCRQRLEWGTHKPRNGTSCHQSQKRSGARNRLPLKATRGSNPVDNLILGFWSPQLWEKTFLVFKTTEFVVICYNRPRKWIHSHMKFELPVLPNYVLYVVYKAKRNRWWQNNFFPIHKLWELKLLSCLHSISITIHCKDRFIDTKWHMKFLFSEPERFR